MNQQPHSTTTNPKPTAQAPLPNQGLSSKAYLIPIEQGNSKGNAFAIAIVVSALVISIGGIMYYGKKAGSFFSSEKFKNFLAELEKSNSNTGTLYDLPSSITFNPGSYQEVNKSISTADGMSVLVNGVYKNAVGTTVTDSAVAENGYIIIDITINAPLAASEDYITWKPFIDEFKVKSGGKLVVPHDDFGIITFADGSKHTTVLSELFGQNKPTSRGLLAFKVAATANDTFVIDRLARFDLQGQDFAAVTYEIPLQ